MRFMKSYETSLDHNHILDYCELLHLLLQFKSRFSDAVFGPVSGAVMPQASRDGYFPPVPIPVRFQYRRQSLKKIPHYPFTRKRSRPPHPDGRPGIRMEPRGQLYSQPSCPLLRSSANISFISPGSFSARLTPDPPPISSGR